MLARFSKVVCLGEVAIAFEPHSGGFICFFVFSVTFWWILFEATLFAARRVMFFQNNSNETNPREIDEY